MAGKSKLEQIAAQIETLNARTLEITERFNANNAENEALRSEQIKIDLRKKELQREFDVAVSPWNR